MNRVLFVCTGNTCRSPMAEAFLKSRNIPNVEVKSAGIYANNGQDASRYAKEVLSDQEIVHQHSSKQLSLEDVEWATLILTMTSSHKLGIQNLYPQYSDKVYTLKGFVHPIQDYDDDVVDPFGGSKYHYLETFNELRNLIEALIKKL